MDFRSIIENLQHDLELIHKWSIRNKLTISPSKSKSMLVGRQHKINKTEISLNLTLGDTLIEWVSSFTYLGLPIDQLLKFNAAIDHMHRKAAYRLKTLQLIRGSLTVYASLRMAKSMILPFFEYASLFVSAANESQLNKIQTLQNRILKLALHLNRLHSTKDLHHRAKELTFKHRIAVNQMKFIARYLTQTEPIFSLINQTDLDIGTRSSVSRNLSVKIPNVDIYRKSFCYKGPKEWNQLPDDLKVSQSFPSFKNKIKNYFLAMYLD